jgi:PII-like signaling protein
VLPALAGYGGNRHWSRDSDISASGDMVVIVSIGDETRVNAALEALQRLLGDHIGVLSVADVRVLRPERF